MGGGMATLYKITAEHAEIAEVSYVLAVLAFSVVNIGRGSSAVRLFPSAPRLF